MFEFLESDRRLTHTCIKNGQKSEEPVSEWDGGDRFLFLLICLMLYFLTLKNPANIEWVENPETIRLENENGCIIAATSWYYMAYWFNCIC